MRILFTAVLMLSVSVPALAQSRAELAVKDAQIEQRLGELEQRYLTGDPAAERLLQRMDVLESSHRALTGEIEQLRYERTTLTQQIQTLTADVDVLKALATEIRQHMDAAEVAAQSSTPRTYGGSDSGFITSQPTYSDPVYSQPTYSDPVYSGPVYSEPVFSDPVYSEPVYSEPTYSEPVFGVPSSQDPSNTYSGTLGSSGIDMSELLSIGQQKLLAGDFSGAQLAFQQYVDINPDSADIDEAYFWLAETHFVRSGFSEAADAYIASMRAAPEGEKAPNAMIGLAASLRNLNNTQSACQTLDGFTAQFPSVASDVREKADIERQRSGCL